MFDYKSSDYYNDYFNQLEKFKLVEPFVDSDNEKDLWNITNNSQRLSSLEHNEKNAIIRKFDNLHDYIGIIEAVNTFHPLQIVVKIPKTFPHHKLMFMTSSLCGYPHLISVRGFTDVSYLKLFDIVNTNQVSWFCLNTPFAETTEGQLNIEIERLEQWIEHQMRSDLPAIIDNVDVINALMVANAYSWENPDEIGEYNHNAQLTFIGDYGKTMGSIKESIGEFDCVKNGSNNYYVFGDKGHSNAKLPYIVVDEMPINVTDFVSLRKQYNWDNETCDKLMPNCNTGDIFTRGIVSDGKEYISYIREHTSEDKINPQWLEFTNEIDIPRDDAYKILDKGIASANIESIPKKHRSIVETVIQETKNEIEKNNCWLSGIKRHPIFNGNIDDEEYQIKAAEEEYYIAIYPYIWSYFALGIKDKDTITWFLISYQNRGAKRKPYHYDLGLVSVDVEELLSYQLYAEVEQRLSSKEMLGRGRFCGNLANKKIAILGIGAIGSILAESLVRSGVRNIGLWDNDIIEPGNLCRSIYSLDNLGNSKVEALTQKLKGISPYCNIKTAGRWDYTTSEINFQTKYTGGNLYGNINYNSQKDEVDRLKDYDLIIDCTASNELLHFLSYSITDKDLISLCITNHSKDLVCASNRDGNPFEIRKMYLSKIEQDTQNFYVEGTGCYSPTFIAKHCDIAALINMAVRDLDSNYRSGKLMHSTSWSYKERGVVFDKLRNFQLNGYPIKLSISEETYWDCIDLEYDISNENSLVRQIPLLGYALGCYSFNRDHIFITHFIPVEQAEVLLTKAYNLSQGVIDYIGDVSFTTENVEIKSALMDSLAEKAQKESINTNNPLLIMRDENNGIKFYLYIDRQFIPFTEN